MYFVIRGTMKSHEKDSLIPIEYFLHDNICAVFFRAPYGRRKIWAMDKMSVRIICQTIEWEIYNYNIIPFFIISV